MAEVGVIQPNVLGVAHVVVGPRIEMTEWLVPRPSEAFMPPECHS